MSPAPATIRVLFCGCAGLYSGCALRELLACAELEVVGVVRSTRVLSARYGFLRGAWHQVRRSGLPYALYLWLATTGAEILSTWSLGRLCRRHALPQLATRDLNDTAGRAFVAAARPDLLVCAYFNQRIGDGLLGLPRLGAVNVHPSLLPDFKGVDPVFFARLRAAPEIGVTVHRIEHDFDTGPILWQQTLTSPAGESVLRTTARLFACGGTLLAYGLGDLLAVHDGQAQDRTGAYDSWPSPAEVQRLRRRGRPLVRLRDLLWMRYPGADDDGAPHPGPRE